MDTELSHWIFQGLFTVQLSRFLLSFSQQLDYIIKSISLCQQLFSSFLNYFWWKVIHKINLSQRCCPPFSVGEFYNITIKVWCQHPFFIFFWALFSYEIDIVALQKSYPTSINFHLHFYEIFLSASLNFFAQKNLWNFHSRGLSYVREKIRTPDTLVRSQVLYPAELRTHILLSWSPTNAGDRNRTGTVFLQQDFKSCASASSATPACNKWDQ